MRDRIRREGAARVDAGPLGQPGVQCQATVERAFDVVDDSIPRDDGAETALDAERFERHSGFVGERSRVQHIEAVEREGGRHAPEQTGTVGRYHGEPIVAGTDDAFTLPHLRDLFIGREPVDGHVVEATTTEQVRGAAHELTHEPGFPLVPCRRPGGAGVGFGQPVEQAQRLD